MYMYLLPRLFAPFLLSGCKKSSVVLEDSLQNCRLLILTSILVMCFETNFWLAFKNITCSHEMSSYKPHGIEEDMDVFQGRKLSYSETTRHYTTSSKDCCVLAE